MEGGRGRLGRFLVDTTAKHLMRAVGWGEVHLSPVFPEATWGDNRKHPNQGLEVNGKAEGWFSEQNHMPGWCFLERILN